jgi:hypothetical protein
LVNGRFDLIGLENDNSLILQVNDSYIRFRRDYKKKLLISENRYGSEKFDIDKTKFTIDVVLNNQESDKIMYYLTTPQN